MRRATGGYFAAGDFCVAWIIRNQIGVNTIMHLTRRDFLRLAGYGGGVVFSAGLPGGLVNAAGPARDFYFVQLSDTHWGFDKAKINADFAGTLHKAIATVNGLATKPDFVVFTGDLTHATDDPKVRRARMAEFRAIASELEVRDVRFLPGEHDASLDRGEAYQEFFGKMHSTFDHKGIHFIALDNVSDPHGILGESQLQWLKADLQNLRPDTPIVVLTHRPLFDLYPQWGWSTGDGDQAIRLLMPFENVSVFYGHIHQENHHQSGHILHHSAKSLIFPLPGPGTVAKRKPLPWDPQHPYQGLGVRGVTVHSPHAPNDIQELPVVAVSKTT